MSRYNAPWDFGVWAWTVGVGALLLCVLVPLCRSSVFARPRRIGAGGIGAAAIVLVFLAAAAFAPRYYEIRGRTLVVRTTLMRFRYELDYLSKVQIARAGQVFTLRSWRAFGVGGFLGFYGYFRSPNLGTFLAFATDKNKLVVLYFPGRVLVISPHDPQGFVEELQRVVQHH